MEFIEYCIKTKNYSTLKALRNYTKSFALKSVAKDVVNLPKDVVENSVILLRDPDKLDRADRRQRERIKDNLAITSYIASTGYVGTRLANYINAKMKKGDKADENLEEIGDDDSNDESDE